MSDQVSNVSPVLQHKIPERSSNDDESDDTDEKDECLEQINLLLLIF